VPIFFLLVFAALGPAKWIPRSGLGWQIDHLVGYFALTFMFCFVWGRPFLAGGALMAAAMLLEGLQAFTPDRHADFYAALISASGAMAAILPADFFIRAPTRTTGRALEMISRSRASSL
jgi:VanZ family protein